MSVDAAEGPVEPPPPSLGSLEATPRPLLSSTDAIAIIVGIVIGAAIFEAPAVVAANVTTPEMLILCWLIGGAVSILGALCYAELGATYPNAGGDYHYLSRAYSGELGFLFVWARMTVIQTGSIALIAFVFGDYVSQLFPLGEFSTSIYAAAAVVLLSLVNLYGLALSRHGQRWLTLLQISGVLLLAVAGLLFAPAVAQEATAAAPLSQRSFGLAMVFVLLTFGGWNEAAFISAELRNPRRNMMRAMIGSIGIITLLYLLLNLALVARLGLDGMAESSAVGAELMRRATGEYGAILISILVAACALASINAMIFTGARANYALGREMPTFRFLGSWSADRAVPFNAVLVQSFVVLLLILLGALTRRGFETMVSYTAPVFWLFFLLTTISLILLRRRDPERERPYRVPGYPVTPLLFAAVCAWLLWSSIAYTGIGAFVGLVVLLSGVPFLFLERARKRLAGR
jgi:basic amino acid/polyamine antiporter, APA family